MDWSSSRATTSGSARARCACAPGGRSRISRPACPARSPTLSCRRLSGRRPPPTWPAGVPITATASPHTRSPSAGTFHRDGSSSCPRTSAGSTSSAHRALPYVHGRCSSTVRPSGTRAASKRRATVEFDGRTHLARWLEAFHPHSMVELDYGGLADLVPADVLREDRSAAEAGQTIAALRQSDWIVERQRAQTLLRLLDERWRSIRALERANRRQVEPDCCRYTIPTKGHKGALWRAASRSSCGGRLS